MNSLNKYSIIFFSCLILSILFITSLQAQEASKQGSSITLKEAVTKAIQNNYRIKLSDKRLEIARNNVQPGAAGMLPSVDLNGTYLESNNDIRQEFSDPTRPVITSNNARNSNLNTAVQLTWTIFDGFQMFAAYDRLKLLYKNGQDALRINMLNTAASVVNAYFNIYQQQEKLKVFDDAVAVSEERLKLAKNKYEVGTGTKLEFLNAQVDLNTDKGNRLRQENLIKQAEIDLSVLITEAPNTYNLLDSLIIRNDLNLNDFKAKALQLNPAVIITQRAQEIAYKETQIIRSAYYPTINLLGSYTLTDQRNGAGLFKRNYNNSINYGLSASWNLFNGNNLNRNVQNARINQQIATLRIDSLKLELSADIEQAFANYKNALDLLELDLANVAVAKQTVQIAQDRYKIGVSTPLEYREAQRNLINLQSRIIEARYAALQASIDLYRLSGQDITLSQ